MASPLATLEELREKSRVRITIDEERSMDVYASPVRYVPEEELRVEFADADENDRYVVSVTWDGSGWTEPYVRTLDENGGERLGRLTDVQVRSSTSDEPQ